MLLSWTNLDEILMKQKYKLFECQRKPTIDLKGRVYCFSMQFTINSVFS